MGFNSAFKGLKRSSDLLCAGPNTPLHTQGSFSLVPVPIGLILRNRSFFNFALFGGKWMLPCFQKWSISIMGNVSGVFETILLHQAQIACRELWEVAVGKGVMVDWHRIWHGFCAFEVWESLCNAIQQLRIQQKTNHPEEWPCNSTNHDVLWKVFQYISVSYRANGRMACRT